MMDKILSIVIPHYRETDWELLPLLCSIRTQVGIDFGAIEVLIVNDAGTPPGDALMSLFPELGLRRIALCENGGPGVARQAGIDQATGAYVMFCDADDALHNVGVLGAFMAEIEAHGPDIITSPWLEELRDPSTGRMTYIPHEDEATWMHGKAFRRDFLLDHDLRFHDDLRVHEDSYFLALAYAAATKQRKVMATTYVWRWNEGSITRRNGGAYTYDATPEFIRAITMAFEELEQRAPDQMPYKAVQFVLYHYFTLHQGHWQLPENVDYLRAAEEALVQHMEPYLHHLYEADEAFIAGIYNEQRQKSFAGGIEQETFDAWLQRVGLAAPILTH